MKEKVEINLSWMTILRVVGLILGLWFLWMIRDIVILFFVVLVMVAAFAPVIDRWSQKMNRVLAVALLYVILLTILTILGLAIVPPVIVQLQHLSDYLPTLASRTIPLFGVWKEMINLSTQGLSSFASQLQAISASVYSTTLGFFGGIVAAFTVLVLTFYLMLEEHGAKKLIKNYLPMENRGAVVDIAQKIGHKMGGWLRGQIALALIVGVIDFIGLSIIGVPFALTLAVWAGLTEIIPYIGPVIGAIPAVIIGFTVSPLIGLITLILYVAVQQLEAHLLVPKVMQKAVGLSPVIIILAILIGGKLAGILGVVLAVPAAAAIGVFIQEYPQLRKQKQN